jgi:hypothetical protein
MLEREADPALFVELAEGGVQRVLIFRVAPAAREGPVPGPGVLFPLGAPDQEDGLGWSGRPQDCHCGFRFCHLFLSSSQPSGDLTA